jgi:serine/threonine protein kinase
VAEAIGEAHRRGLVHADLKPENIIIPRDGRVRVVDFGVAKLVGGAAIAASGTPAYMAPERWHGVPPTGAIDIWALGLTLHELIVGRHPIADAKLLHLAFAVDALELPELPAEPWAQLVRDCLQLDPAARPSAEEVIRRLDRILDPLPKDRLLGVVLNQSEEMMAESHYSYGYYNYKRLNETIGP